MFNIKQMKKENTESKTWHYDGPQITIETFDMFSTIYCELNMG